MPAAASSPVRQQKYLAHNALPSTRDHSHHPIIPNSPSTPPQQKHTHTPTTHRRQRDWTVASIGSKHPISPKRDSAKALTSRTIPASAGPVPRSPPTERTLGSQIPIPHQPLPNENTPPPATHRRQRDWTVASIGSKHPISPKRDSAKALTSRTIPASAGPAPLTPRTARRSSTLGCSQ